MRHLAAPLSILAVAIALMAPSAAVAQESTPAPMASSAAVPEPLAAWAAAWAAGDVDAILATYTEDASFVEVPIGVATHNQDELRAHIEGLLGAFPDFSLVVTDAFVAGDRAAAEWVVTGTYSGEFPGMPPGQGQAIMLRGSSILELEDGQVSADREYWDAYAFLIALGAVPAPEAAGTPTP